MNTQLQKITDILKQYGFKRSSVRKANFFPEDTYKSYLFLSKKFPSVQIRFLINNKEEYYIELQYQGDNIGNISEKYEDRMEETEVLLKLFRKLKNFKKEEKVVRTKINKRRKLITIL